mgnify:CR=1 FL=1
MKESRNSTGSRPIWAGRVCRLVSIVGTMSILCIGALGSGSAAAAPVGSDAINATGATAPTSLYGISCTTPRACIATGWYNNGAGNAVAGAARWSGALERHELARTKGAAAAWDG